MPAAAGNQTLDDLVANINAALQATSLGTSVAAGRSGNRITLSTNGFYGLAISSAAADAAQTDLHLGNAAIGPAITYTANTSYQNYVAPVRTFGAADFLTSVQGILDLFQNGKLNAFTSKVPMLNQSVDDVLGITQKLKDVVQQLKSETGDALKVTMQGQSGIVARLKAAIGGLPSSVSADVMNQLDEIFDVLQYASLNAERTDVPQPVNLASYIVAAIAPLTQINRQLSSQGIDVTQMNAVLNNLKTVTPALPDLRTNFAAILNAGSVQSHYTNAKPGGFEQAIVFDVSWQPGTVKGVSLGSIKSGQRTGPFELR